MKLIKNLINFYVFSNLHVALAGFSLTRITEMNYNIPNYNTSLFVGFSIIFSYNFIRYVEIRTHRLSWFQDWFSIHFFKIVLLSILSLVGLLTFLVNSYVNLKAVFFILPFGFMTMFYVIPIFKNDKIDVSFRNLPFIKIFSIAIAWAGITALFPIVNFGLQLSFNEFFVFLINFFFVFAITLPFDIRDVSIDDEKLKTIPQVFGVLGAKIIGALSIALLLSITYILKKRISFDVILISIITILFLLFSSSKKNRFYSSFWVESIPILWLLIIMYFR